MFVKEVLKQKGDAVAKTSPETPAVELARMLSEKRIGFLLVCDEKGDIVGAVSERDIVGGVADNGGDLNGVTAADLMTREVVTCSPNDTLQKIMTVMTAQRMRHLPVVKDGELVGLISIGDVMKYRLEETLLDEKTMRDYIAGRLY